MSIANPAILANQIPAKMSDPTGSGKRVVSSAGIANPAILADQVPADSLDFNVTFRTLQIYGIGGYGSEQYGRVRDARTPNA